MRGGICCSAVLFMLGLSCGLAFAELRLFSLPGEGRSWKNVKEGSLDESRYLELIDMDRYADGILPIEPQQLVPVPLIPEDLAGSGLTQAKLDSILFAFSRYVARRDVIAQQEVVLPDQTIPAGTVLIPKWTNFPRQAQAVRILRLAGITEIPAMINVAESFPRPPAGNKYNKSLNLIRLGIFESSMTGDQLEAYMAKVFDGDPNTHFPRVDRVGQDVAQYWNLYIDLGNYFPVRLFRFYPSPLLPVRVASYALYLGMVGTERTVAGFNLDLAGNPGFPIFTKIASTFPTFVLEQGMPVNTKDTVNVFFDPPRKLRHLRLEFSTALDYDLAEVEVFADGFVPKAVYTSKPLPLPPATLGRIFWEETKIGDPAKSRVEVRVQTGLNTEPLVLFRVNEFERAVEWKETGALVVDRRPGSKTLGQVIDLNDPQFNLDVREIFSALLPAEREKVRLSRAEYIALPGNKRRQVEPDLEFWSGFQAVGNGQRINAPSGRPYIQIEISFFSDAPEAATVVRNLKFEYSTPQLSETLTGEIAPAVDVIAGEDTTFVLALNAVLGSSSNGFNRLQVFTPARISRVESISVARRGQVQNLRRVTDEDQLLPGEGEFKELYVSDKQFVVGFPTLKAQGVRDSLLMRLQFTGRVIDFRTNFRANAFLDTLSPGAQREFTANGVLVRETQTGDTLAFYLPQPIDEGNVINFEATEQLSDRNSMAVIADISRQSKSLISHIAAAPNPFTPNGDGINDQLLVGYDIQRLLAPRPVRLEIYDLSGHRIKGFEQELISGGYSWVWDGRNEEGELVPPGIYLLRISAEADDASVAETRLIAVAY